MAIFIGTSGFAYKEWVGPFYPPGIEVGAAMLRPYSDVFPTVEINNTFYQMPSEETLLRWKETAGPGFRFAVKARRTITHRRDFAVPGGYFALFLERIAALGKALGPVLFQFAPTMSDSGRLADFAGILRNASFESPPFRPVVEVRQPALFTPVVTSSLRASGVDLCLSDQVFDPAVWPDPHRTAYIRLRKAPYDTGWLKDFASRLRGWDRSGIECYVFFKHETAAPGYAKALLGLVRQA